MDFLKKNSSTLLFCSGLYLVHPLHSQEHFRDLVALEEPEEPQVELRDGANLKAWVHWGSWRHL